MLITFTALNLFPIYASDSSSSLPSGVKNLIDENIQKYHGRDAGSSDYALFEKCFEYWEKKGKTDYQKYIKNIVVNSGINKGLGLGNWELKGELKSSYDFNKENTESAIRSALKKQNIALSEDDWDKFYKKKILTGIFNLTTDSKKYENLSNLLVTLDDKTRTQKMLSDYGIGVQIAGDDYSTIGTPDSSALEVTPEDVKLTPSLKSKIEASTLKYHGRNPSDAEYEYFRLAYAVWLAEGRKSYNKYVNEIVVNSSGRGLKPGLTKVFGDDSLYETLKEHYNFDESVASERVRTALKKQGIALSNNDWDTFNKKKLETGIFNLTTDKKKYENLNSLMIQLESSETTVQLLAKYGIGVSLDGDPVVAATGDSNTSNTPATDNSLDSMDVDTTVTTDASDDVIVEDTDADTTSDTTVADTTETPANITPESIKKSGVVYNTGGVGLRIRCNPWDTQIGGMPEGTKVTVYEVKKADDGSLWYRLEESGVSKYMMKDTTTGAWSHSDYIKLTDDAANQVASTTDNNVIVPATDSSDDGTTTTVADTGLDSEGRLKGAPGYEEALEWAVNGSKTFTNPNNGKTGTGAWSGYCLAHVARCWSVGAGSTVSQLSQYCAKDACNAIKNAGMMKSIPAKGAIPAGSPVFWDGVGDKGSTKYGHIAIATGKVDSRGVPTVVDTGTTPISIQPIDRYGSSDGYGQVSGTPLI